MVVHAVREPRRESQRLGLIEREKRVLGQVAAGVSLSKVLEELILAVEAETGGQMYGSILLIDADGKRLLHGAAPHLPQVYNEAVHGLEIGEARGSCGTAAHRGSAVFVTDIATDPLWARYRELTLPHGLRACWSTPIKGADGRLLGTFGNYYREPRSPTPLDLEVIAQVTHTAAVVIERHFADQALQESEARFRTLVEVSPQIVWLCGPAGEIVYCNQFWQDFTGLRLEATGDGAWLEAVHPAHRDRVLAQWESVLARAEPFETEIEFKRAGDDSYRCFVMRGTCVRDANGGIRQWIVIGLDIQERKRAEEARNLLAQELAHRIRNIFTVVSGLASATSRGHPEAQAFVRDFRDRLLALSVANEHVVRPERLPSFRGEKPATTVQRLVTDLLAPYVENFSDRFRLSGDDISLGSNSSTALALIVHELATNAVKYGALSCETGRVRIEGCRSSDLYRMTWRESGGPPVSGPPERSGFGTAIAARSAGNQLGGTIEHEWAPAGLIATLEVPLENMAR
jgi:PAS domain S-box-containing protein